MRKMPFLKITCSVALGIYLNSLVEINACSLLFILLGLGALVLSSVNNLKINVGGFWKKIGVVLFFMVLGAFAQKQTDYSSDQHHFSHYVCEDGVFVGKVLQVKGGKYPKYIAQIQHIICDSIQYDVSGKLLVKSKDRNIDEGDIIAFSGTCRKMKQVENEFEFDMSIYYKNKQVFHSLFSSDLNILDSSDSWLKGIKSYVLSSLDSLKIEQRSKAVIKAMLLGDKTDLKEIDQIFRKTGTSHVLAISGLHVGIVGTILFFFFSFVPPKLEYLKYIIVVAGVWLFCLVSGAMPSTIRASIMLTCFLFGKALGRTGLSYNYCFAAAFLMLLDTPGLIFDIGFQFSFLAVLGILYFYEDIYKALQFKGFYNYAWQLFSVSMSAQIMITPLSLYYFHDFPLLFLLTSLIAIPATFVIISLSVVTLILDFEIFDLLSLEYFLEWFISSFLKLLEIFSSNDQFLITGLYPSPLEIGLYYAAMFSCTIYFKRKIKKALWLFALSFIGLFVYQFFINKEIEQAHVSIYAHQQVVQIDLFSSGSVAHFYENKNRKESSEWTARNRRIKYAMNKIEYIPLHPVNQLLDFGSVKVGVIYTNEAFMNGEFLQADYLLLKVKLDASIPSAYHAEIIDFAHNDEEIYKRNKQIIINL